MASQAEASFRGALLTEAIRSRLLTDEELAAKAGVTTKSVWRWRHGISQPRLKHVRSLAEALGVDPADFYDEPKAAA